MLASDILLHTSFLILLGIIISKLMKDLMSCAITNGSDCEAFIARLRKKGLF